MNINIELKEIYLIEQYTSIEYFGQLRDKWEKMVRHVEGCLDVFMKNLPLRYRARALSDQPDVVWGGLVLPNFRSTLDGLNKGYILLSHGDVNGLDWAEGPLGDHKGQMDYWSGWMSGEDEGLYASLMDECVEMAHKITMTESGGWGMLRLLPFAKHLNLPDSFKNRRYRVNPSVFVRTGEQIPVSGIYVPEGVNSGANFLSTRYNEARQAKELVRIEDLFLPSGEKYDERFVYEKRDCTWYLVERISDGDGNTPVICSAKVRGGEICPKSGFYITPAKTTSRQYFQEGALMPSYDTEFGMTIWQWDEKQD
jgi:hypothetical protein